MAEPDDTLMTDAPGEIEEPEGASSSHAEVLQSIEPVDGEKQDDAEGKDENAEAVEGEDEEDGVDNEPEEDIGGRPVSNKQYKALKAITEVLTEHRIKKGNEDYQPSLLFKRVPNKRNLPDYYQIIKEPSAISTLKGKIQRKTYSGIPEFVRDFALVVHNAQVYNRPNSGPVRDVFVLDAVFKEELKKLVDQGLAKADEIEYPDLGEIPAATPEPDPVSEVEEEEDEADGDGEGEGEEDEEDEDGEGDDSEDGRKKKKRGGRKSKGDKCKGDDDEEDGRKRRGRPPKVDTPMEARIKAVIKGMRKPKDNKGSSRIRHFERLPDKVEHPHYYQEIREPIAMDTIKKKAKRKKYRTLDDLVRDFELMFKNAMAYNLENSEIYKDAVVLLREAKDLADAEKARPDEEFALDDGRIPLPEGIEYKGEMCKVGDWIHIQNPNDVTKPIVAQVYRTWKDSEGQMWINACWYYRPEQTIHQYEKHFYPNEVVKTGQYRDHHIEEVIDRCFVMFFTRYNRGRPRNLDSAKEVYVCEARYNEEKHKFNKIKTWASCLPDEVRDKDYEMDLFDLPRKIKKQPSPIKHLLKDDAKDTDEFPTPQWGNKNAPPIIGGIYKAPRDENQSPPPEATPPPPPTPPPAPVRVSQPIMLPHSNSQQGMTATPSGAHLPPSHLARPSMSMTPQLSSYQSTSVSPAPQYPRQPPYQPPASATPYQNNIPPTPTQLQSVPFTPQQQLHQPPYQPALQQGYTPQPYNRPTVPPVQPQPTTYPPYPPAQVYERRAPEAYTLSDTANELIPKDIRDQYPRDEKGRILFFTKPPIDTRHIVSGKSEADKGKPLKHTDEYLKAKAARDKLIAERQTKRSNPSEVNGLTLDAASYKRLKPNSFPHETRDVDGRIAPNVAAATELARRENQQISALKTRAINMLSEGMVNATVSEYLAKYGDKALLYWDEDQKRMKERNAIAVERESERERQRQRQRQREKEMSTWRNAEEDTKWLLSQDRWTGRRLIDGVEVDGEARFEDDFDNRLPR